MKGFFIFPVLQILLLSTPAFADFQKGLDAYQSGDYATALKEWEPLAEQGNADAQYNLGVMYYQGKGAGWIIFNPSGTFTFCYNIASIRNLMCC